MILKDFEGNPVIDAFGNVATKKLAKETRKYMMETSKKPVSIPPKLYHATAPHKLESIMLKGLQPHPLYGEIYFCEEIEQCLRFIKPPAIIFEVETKNLFPHFLFLSRDHKKTPHTNFEAYTYYKPIDPKYLKWGIIEGEPTA